MGKKAATQTTTVKDFKDIKVEETVVEETTEVMEETTVIESEFPDDITKEESGIHGSMILDTEGGPIHIINTNLVPPKMIDIMKHFLDQFDIMGHGLYAIMFRDDGYPRVEPDVVTNWMYYPDTKSAVCNLSDIIDGAFNDTMDNEKAHSYCSKTFAWMRLLKGFYHECHHAQEFMVNRDKLDSSSKARNNEEKDAISFADESLEKEVKVIDLEVEFSSAMATMFNSRFASIERGILKNGDDSQKTWLKAQSKMLEYNTHFYIPPKPENAGKAVTIDTFKEFLCWNYKGDPESPEWNVATIGQRMVYQAEPDTAADVVTEVAPVVESNEEYSPAPWQVDTLPAGTQPAYAGWGGAGASQPAQAPVQQPVYQPVQQPVYQQAVAPVQQPSYQNPGQAPTNMAGGFKPPVPAAVAGMAQEPGVNPNAVIMGAGAYEPTGVAPEEMGAIMKGLYSKLFQCTFEACGFVCNGWSMPNNIQGRVMLNDMEKRVVKHMSHVDANNQCHDNVPVTDFIIGKFVDKAGVLPGFEFTVANPDGSASTRKLIPQNPNKTAWENGKPTQNLTKSALEAQNGNCIMWIVNGDEPDAKKSYLGKLTLTHENPVITMYMKRFNQETGRVEWPIV